MQFYRGTSSGFFPGRSQGLILRNVFPLQDSLLYPLNFCVLVVPFFAIYGLSTYKESCLVAPPLCYQKPIR